MRLVRFLKRSIHNDTVIEAGDQALLADDVVMAPHMVDLGEAPSTPRPVLVSSNDAASPAPEWQRRVKATEEAMRRAVTERQAERASSTEG